MPLRQATMGKFFKVNVQVQDGYIFCGDESNRLYMDDFIHAARPTAVLPWLQEICRAIVSNVPLDDESHSADFCNPTNVGRKFAVHSTWAVDQYPIHLIFGGTCYVGQSGDLGGCCHGWQKPIV